MFNATNKEAPASNLNDTHNVDHDLHEAALNAGRKARNMFNAASTEISDDIGLITSQIRKNPIQSSMIALSAGVILGVLFRRL